MNIRMQAYFAYHAMRGNALGQVYKKLLVFDQTGFAEDAVQGLIYRLLQHCQKSVPYYSRLMGELPGDIARSPEAYLRRLPILTREKIRREFDDLKSVDLKYRRWHYTMSSGSTGEPVRVIQDAKYWDWAVATQLLAFRRCGREVGERLVYVWGSLRDIRAGTEGLKMKIANLLTGTRYLNAYQMRPDDMRHFIRVLSEHPPRLIVASAQAIYQLSKFVKANGLCVAPQHAINTSAGTLYPFMRREIEEVFQCPVLDRYGSSEVGDVACECFAREGLHVFPWSNYIEVLNEEGQPVPDGVEGDIVVTSLNNYAMPLVRYRIGDRGTMISRKVCRCGRTSPIIEAVVGRNSDTFRVNNGTLVNGEYFTQLLGNRGWVWKFQVIQKNYTQVLFKIVSTTANVPSDDLNEITNGVKAVMGANCIVEFDFVNEIQSSPSGKYRYTICEMAT